MSKTHIYLQARLGSARLNEKILKEINGKSIFEIIIERLQKIKNISDIILVTGTYEKNKKLVEHAETNNISFYCGNEKNILDRFYNASKYFDSDSIIRITGDCPLIDFNIINNGFELYKQNHPDILSINRIRTYPHGFDFEIFNSFTLEKCWRIKREEFENENDFLNFEIPPTKYMFDGNNFTNYDLVHSEDLSKIRLTLDYAEDFELIKQIFMKLYKQNPNFALDDILNLIKNEPNLLDINKSKIIF